MTEISIMPKARFSISMPLDMSKRYAALAAERGVTFNAIICATLFSALPKLSTAKPLSAAERKEQAKVDARAKRIAEVEAKLAEGLAAGKPWNEVVLGLPIPSHLVEAWYDRFAERDRDKGE